MAKLTTNDLTSLTSNEANAVSTINENFAAVEAAMEKTLSRDGTTPNQMEADFDMNSFDILNAGSVDAEEFLLDGIPLAAQNVFSTVAVSGQGSIVADSPTDTLTLAAGSNVTITTNPDTDTVTISAAADGTAIWGSISGTLSNQTDLQSALDGKANSSHTHTSAVITDFEEAVEDVIGSTLTSGSNITIDYNDTTGLVTISATATGGGGDTIVFQTNVTDFKDSVQAATTASINISNPGTDTFDGVTLTAGQRLLVKNQTTASQNGIYVFDTSSTPLVRSDDADDNTEVTSGLLVLCEDGATNASTLFTLSTPDPIVVGTTALTFESIVLPSNPEVLKEVTTATYTLVATDPNKWLKMNRSTSQTITLPSNASVRIPVNSVIWVHQYGTGTVTLSAAGGVTIRSPNSVVATNARYAVIRLKKIATNEWSATFFNASGTATWGSITGTLSSQTDLQTALNGKESIDVDILRADVTDDLVVGYTTTGYNAGTRSSGTFRPDVTLGCLQYAVNGGAHTLEPPNPGTGKACSMVIQYTNNGSAGSITTSGFTKVTGDSLTTTNGDDFLLYVTVVNGFSHLAVVALQ